MNSLKIFSSLKTRVANLLSYPERSVPDPFDHPEIYAMNLRELADLPLPGRPMAKAVEKDSEQHETLPLARCA